jgi:hypothetical protein
MNKLSTVRLTLLISFVAVLTSNLSTYAVPLKTSTSEHLLLANIGRNSYRYNWEVAIREGIIKRPSRVPDSETAWRLFLEAYRKGDKYNATRRLAQYLVIYSEEYGVYAALEEERRINRELLRRTGKNIRRLYPLFNQIFPQDDYPYPEDEEY